MNRQIIVVSLFFFVCLVTTLFSCKKGDTGLPSVPGNAVNVSDSFKLTNADYEEGLWGFPAGAGAALFTPAKVATISIAKLTDKVVNAGTVLVYFKSIDGMDVVPNQYTLLPYTIPAFRPGILIRIAYGFEVGRLRIYYYFERTDAAAGVPNIYSENVQDFSFRYVIIPGSDGFKMTAPPVDYNDYQAVVDYYHLQR